MADKILHLTNENFDAVINDESPVFVDFWATWCPPCRMVNPFVEQLSEEYEGKAKICKVNTDEQPEIAARYQVETIPTLCIFKKGELLEREIGAKPKHALEAMIDKHL